jgi:hypothetical protein
VISDSASFASSLGSSALYQAKQIGSLHSRISAALLD